MLAVVFLEEWAAVLLPVWAQVLVVFAVFASFWKAAGALAAETQSSSVVHQVLNWVGIRSF